MDFEDGRLKVVGIGGTLRTGGRRVETGGIAV
jgi:hypothetical protein